MAKKKKTRKQKVQSDLRHQHHVSHSENSAIDTSSETPVEPEARSNFFQYTAAPSAPLTRSQEKSMVITDYRYLSGDLRKTAFLTVGIVIAQIVLYFFVNKQF